MVTRIIHAVVPDEDQQCGLEVLVRGYGSINLLNNAIHFVLLGDHIWAGRRISKQFTPKSLAISPSWTTLVPNMIQSQIMKNQSVPVVILELVRDMTGDIVVNLCVILGLVSVTLLSLYLRESP